jgi:hypothetical protein
MSRDDSELCLAARRSTKRSNNKNMNKRVDEPSVTDVMQHAAAHGQYRLLRAFLQRSLNAIAQRLRAEPTSPAVAVAERKLHPLDAELWSYFVEQAGYGRLVLIACEAGQQRVLRLLALLRAVLGRISKRLIAVDYTQALLLAARRGHARVVCAILEHHQAEVDLPQIVHDWVKHVRRVQAMVNIAHVAAGGDASTPYQELDLQSSAALARLAFCKDVCRTIAREEHYIACGGQQKEYGCSSAC